MTRHPDRLSWRRLVGAAALVLAAGAPRPLSAQGQALVVSVHGGRHTPLINLTDAGDDMVSGFSFGGGLGVQLNRNVALRGMLTYHRTRYRGTTIALADSGAAQYVAAADLQAGWPGTSAFVPYIYVGGGAVATSWDDPAAEGATRLAGRFGVGLNRVGGLGAWFLEVGGLLYEFDDIGLSRMQFDLEGRLGFALALGL